VGEVFAGADDIGVAFEPGEERVVKDGDELGGDLAAFGFGVDLEGESELLGGGHGFGVIFWRRITMSPR